MTDVNFHNRMACPLILRGRREWSTALTPIPTFSGQPYLVDVSEVVENLKTLI